MIVGSIIEVAWNATGQADSVTNGASSVVFNTVSAAETWCRLQSQSVVYGTQNYTTSCLCVMINCNDSSRRWWYNGIEYTG